VEEVFEATSLDQRLYTTMPLSSEENAKRMRETRAESSSVEKEANAQRMRETRAGSSSVEKEADAQRKRKERAVASANKGNRSAQFNVGIMYFLGEGCEKNIVEAAKWFGQAAEQGHAAAQFNVGLMFDSGTLSMM
jgi:TPR repeat protein